VLPVSMVALGSMAVVYGLSRTRHYRWGAMLLIAQLFITILMILMNTDGQFVDAAAATVDYLAIAVLLASFLLSVRQTIIVASLGLTVVALLPWLLPGVLPITVFGRLTFLTIMSAFVVIVVLLRRRDQEQVERQSRELAASEARYRIVTELISDYAYSFTIEPDGTFVHEWITEDSFRRITGYTHDEIDAQGNFALFHPDDVPAVERSLEALLRGESSGGEVRIITRSGEVRWLHIYRRPLWDQVQNRVIQIFGVAQDITERKRTEETLRATNRMLERSRDTLSRLIHQIPIGIQVFDASGLCTDVNQAHLDIFGVASREQLVGRYNLFEDPMAESVGTSAGARRALAGETVHLGDLSFDFANADPRYAATRGRRTISVSFFPVLDENEQIVNLVALNQDTTARKRAESQQVELAVEKERVQMLQHFIRDTSHDLRTPLTTIKTSLYLLERTINDPAKRQRYITVIKDQTARLHQLLEDLLSLSQLDKSSVEEFSFEMRSLNLLLQNVVAGQQEAARRKNHTLTLSVESNLPPILVDDRQLNRALTNILTNAVNYTPDGGQIGVRAFLRDDRIAVEIQDNGIGIDEQDLARIFDRFFRADAARGSESGGVGLGLTIARRVIEAHGGDIEVESTVGQGTTVRVWLPVVSDLPS
jgi:PAS domain S-box-containing protein